MTRPWLPSLCTMLALLPTAACRSGHEVDELGARWIRPEAGHCVTETSLILRVHPDSRTGFDALAPAARAQLVADAWDEVQRRMPQRSMAMLGYRQFRLTPEGLPDHRDLDGLMNAFHRSIHDGDSVPIPPPGCEYDEHTGMKPGGGIAALSIKCRMPVFEDIRCLDALRRPYILELDVGFETKYPPRPSPTRDE